MIFNNLLQKCFQIKKKEFTIGVCNKYLNKNTCLINC